MGSFGGVLGGFAEGFQGGYRLGLGSREQKLQEYRYGPAPDAEVEAMPGSPKGDGSVPTTKTGTDTTTTGSTTGTGDGSASSGVNDVDTMEIAGRLKGDLMKDFGLNEYAANGIVGSLAAESGGFKMLQEIHPTVKGSRGGFGYAQWTGPRRVQFEEYAAKNNLDPKSYEANYGFLKQELQGPEGKILGQLKNAKSNEEATDIFTGSAAEKRGFLRPGTVNLSGRNNWTNKIAGIKPATVAQTAAAGVKDAVTEQGGDPDSPLAEGLADLKAKDEEEGEPAADQAAANMIPIPEAPVTQVAGWEKYAQPAWEEEEPTLFAADGGAIPDKFNPSRDFTQMPAQSQATGTAGVAPRVGGSSSWQPRRVGQAAATPAFGSGPTASQLKFRELQAARQPMPVAAAPVAEAAPVKQGPTNIQTQLARAKNQRYGQPWEGGHSRASERSQERRIAQLQQARKDEFKRLGYKKGGKVPAPGKPKKGEFEEQIRRETRGPSSGRADEAGQGARDAAARRINAQRGINSTAIDPDGYWQKPTAPRKRDTPRHRSGGGGGGGTDTTKTSSTETLRQPATGLTIPSPAPYEPGGGAMPTGYQPRPGRLSDENAEPAFERGTVEEGAIPQGETSPSPEPVVAGPGAAFDVGTGWRGRRVTQRPARDVQVLPAEPAVPDPDSMWTARDEEYKRRQAPPSGPGREPPPKPRAAVEPGAWINGRFVPMSQAQNTTGPGMFAEGGIIPEDPMQSDRADAAAYQQPQQQARPQPEDRQPTPKLMQHVGEAVKGGMDFLTRTFGLDGGGGAIRTPESQGAVEGGARRLAMGEGAASPEEIQAIDDKIDPNREMTESDRHMERMVKTMQWYLMNGRKEDAEGAAASIMQYGSKKFSQLGSMAGAAYKEYQKTGDKNALEDAVGYLEKAYEYIPDGGSFDVISIDPESGKLMTTKRNADGSEENMEIDPAQLPGLLQQVQSGSAYWKEISKLADPEGTRQKERFAQEEKTAAEKRRQELADRGDERTYKEKEKAGDRTYEEQQADEKFAREREENDRVRKLEQQMRIEEKKIDEALLRSRPKDKKGGEIDPAAVREPFAKYLAAKRAVEDDPENADAKAALDAAGSELYDAVEGDLDWLKKAGVDMTGPAEEGGFTLSPGSTKPPIAGAKRMKDKDGNPIWAVQGSDGKWSKVEG
jgi:Phage tail lysozyme